MSVSSEDEPEDDAPYGRGRVRREAILDDIIAGYLILGCWPRSREYRAFGNYSIKTVIDRCGSYPEALDDAQERYTKREDEWPEPEVEDYDR